MLFRDRIDAGRRLAAEVHKYRDEAPIVLGLPRGGVPVADEVARALGAPLDVIVVRKVGAPFQPELGIGAIAEGGLLVLHPETMAAIGVSIEEAKEIAADQAIEVERRVRRFRGDHPAPDLRGKTVILVDDGIATGGTMQAAIRAVRQKEPKRVVLAVPVAAFDTLEMLRPEVDDVVCIESSHYLHSIGRWYRDFDQTTDEEVIELLNRARLRIEQPAADPPRAKGPAASVRPVTVRAGRVTLAGDLTVPHGAEGIVLFAHGSGSSRKSPRNRLVASELAKRGLATLLFDLLTPKEEAEDALTAELRFNIPLLAERLVDATRWVKGWAETSHLKIGYFGASTGAAAALVAAARLPEAVMAVVSRGGRPDLAGADLPRVRAPTLLIVGEADTDVLELNRQAASQLGCTNKIAVVPGATHLFEEPMALEQVAALAGEWLSRYLMTARLAAGGAHADARATRPSMG